MGLHEQMHGDSLIHTATYNAMVRAVRRLANLRFLPGDFNEANGLVSLAHKVVPVEAVVVGGGRRWERANWTGTASGCLRIPYDGVTAPSYVSEATFAALTWTAMPADDGSDDRANAMYIRLSETSGPVFHVHRA